MIYDEGYVENQLLKDTETCFGSLENPFSISSLSVTLFTATLLKYALFNLCFLHKSTGKRTKFHCSDFRS